MQTKLLKTITNWAKLSSAYRSDG